MSEQDSSPAQGDIGELIRAVYTTYPSVAVEVGLRRNTSTGSDAASVVVIGLPDQLAGHLAETADSRLRTTPSGRYGVHLYVDRLGDDDLAAALSTALAFITDHAQAEAVSR